MVDTVVADKKFWFMSVPTLAPEIELESDRMSHTVSDLPVDRRDSRTFTPSTTSVHDGPVPMSMPAILRNPRMSRMAASPAARQTRDGFIRNSVGEAQGRFMSKRRERRSENGRFASNPHAVRPSPSDYFPDQNPVHSTFSDSTLETLSKAYGCVEDASMPAQKASLFELDSAIKGQFTLSLRDAQDFLRARLGCAESMQAYMHALETQALLDYTAPLPCGSTFAESLIFAVEREILQWLRQTVHVPTHDSLTSGRKIFVYNVDDRDRTVVELRRAPASLLWQVDDAFSRLAVHCVARTFQCPSFSRDVLSPNGDMSRMTWILHPNPLLRSVPTRRLTMRRPLHRRNSSASTTASAASVMTAGNEGPGPLTLGMLQHAVAGIDTPPSTEYELTDSTGEMTDDDSVVFASESEL